MPRQRKDKYGAFLPDRDKPLEFHQTAKFKKLNAKWAKKLLKSGFEEIEDTNSPREWMKQHHAHYFSNRHDLSQFEDVKRYYELATHLLNTYKFKNKTHRAIWEHHSNGIAEREISKILKIRDYDVRKTIRRIRLAIKRDAKDILNDLDSMRKSND